MFSVRKVQLPVQHFLCFPNQWSFCLWTPFWQTGQIQWSLGIPGGLAPEAPAGTRIHGCSRALYKTASTAGSQSSRVPRKVRAPRSPSSGQWLKVHTEADAVPFPGTPQIWWHLCSPAPLGTTGPVCNAKGPSAFPLWGFASFLRPCQEAKTKGNQFPWTFLLKTFHCEARLPSALLYTFTEAINH